MIIPKFCSPVAPVLMVGVLPDQLWQKSPFGLVTSLKPLIVFGRLST